MRLTNAHIFAHITLILCVIWAAPQAEAQPPARSGYDVAWYDEFDGNTVDTSLWDVVTSYAPTNQSKHLYHPSMVTVSGGNLIITSDDQGPNNTLSHRSGQIISKTRQQYGRWEIRAKLPSTKGTWPAIWLLSNVDVNPWPSQGEIDIMENRGNEPLLTSSAYHYGTNPPYNHQFTFRENRSVAGGNDVDYHSGFHTYAAEWDPDQVRFYVDDVHYASIHNADVNDFMTTQTDGMKLLINTAIGGTFLPNPDASSVWPQTLEVDYVHAYTKNATPPVLTFENGGFESNGGSLADWTVFGNRLNPTPNVRADVQAVKSGASSLKLYGQFNGATNYSGVEQGISVSAGDELVARASAFISANDSIAGSNNEATLNIDFYKNNYGFYGSSDYLYSVNSSLVNANSNVNTWHDKEFRVTVPANAVSARISVVFIQRNNAGGSVNVDDVDFRVVETHQIPPASINIFRGSLDSGTVADVIDSDDNYFKTLRQTGRVPSNGFRAGIETAAVIAPNVSDLKVRVESHATSTGLDQIVQLYNWTTGQWQVVDQRSAAVDSDRTDTITIGAGVRDNFIDANGNIKARTAWKPNGRTKATWTAWVDQFEFIYTD